MHHFRRATRKSGRNAASNFSIDRSIERGTDPQTTLKMQHTFKTFTAFRPLFRVALRMGALLSLASCATTATQSLNETTAVTRSLLGAEHFGRFQDAVALSTDQFGNTYVVDRAGPSIIKFNDKGDSIGVISGFGREQYQFDSPHDVDARMTNTIYIADLNNKRVERYTKDFAYSATIAQTETKNDRPFFTDPLEVATDDAGNLYILDGYNKKVVKAKQDLTLERTIGSYTNATSPEGALVNPVHIAVDNYENLIVYDRAANSLLAYDNLGNLRKKRSLEGLLNTDRIAALAARGDTVFALNSSGSRSVIQLFHTGTLTSLGAWEILRESDAPLIDLDIRNGVTLLARDRVIRANISVMMEEMPKKK